MNELITLNEFQKCKVCAHDCENNHQSDIKIQKILPHFFLEVIDFNSH